MSASADLNLNRSLIQEDDGPGTPLMDFSLDAATCSVYFRNLEARLIEHLSAADSICGCVAWLTSRPILEALASKSAVAIVVQKEDFLRPDIKAPRDWKNHLRRLYAALPAEWDRLDDSLADTSLYLMSCAHDPRIDAVRCAGVRNAQGVAISPRCHHKFLVFCRDEPIIGHSHFHDKEYIRRVPYAVWTGSFNCTQNATQSLENAVVISDRDIAMAYFKEWAQIEAVSEPLDWQSEWMEPEWRIGT